MNVPFVATALSGWWEFFRFNGARGADWDSAWFLLCRHLAVCPSTGLINAASTALMVGIGAVGLGARSVVASPSSRDGSSCFPFLVLFLLLGKVYSPQFSLWLLPWLVLILPGRAPIPRVRGRRRRGLPDAVLVLR